MPSMNLTCAVCKEFYKNSDAVMATDCGHVFHATCMSEARKESMNCPSCRTPIRATYRLYLTFEDDKQVAELMSTMKQLMEQKSLLQQRLDRSEQDHIKLVEQLTKKGAENKELDKKLDSINEQNETRSKEIESKIIEAQKLEEALNSSNPQGTASMLQEEIKILQEKNNFISKELNKEIHAGMQLSVEKMKLENMLQQFKTSMPATPPSLPATLPATPPSKATTETKNKKTATRNEVDQIANLPSNSPPTTSRDCIQCVVIKNVKETFADEAALKSYIFKLTDIMDLHYSHEHVQEVTVTKHSKSTGTITLVAKFQDLFIKARFLSRKNKLKENEETKDLLLQECVTNYTNLLCHYAKTLKPRFKYVFSRNNVVYAKKDEFSHPIRINGRRDVDKLKHNTRI